MSDIAEGNRPAASPKALKDSSMNNKNVLIGFSMESEAAPDGTLYADAL